MRERRPDLRKRTRLQNIQRGKSGTARLVSALNSSRGRDVGTQTCWLDHGYTGAATPRAEEKHSYWVSYYQRSLLSAGPSLRPGAQSSDLRFQELLITIASPTTPDVCRRQRASFGVPNQTIRKSAEILSLDDRRLSQLRDTRIEIRRGGTAAFCFDIMPQPDRSTALFLSRYADTASPWPRSGAGRCGGIDVRRKDRTITFTEDPIPARLLGFTTASRGFCHCRGGLQRF